ncbi:MAG: DUF4189 domain-containing protein [Leptospiraceae bacterium]|nr:DUF4189 domain-containing protein [Leptospiraceae bacterium]MCK6380389.1 DUF4189 domain-containing protein [Leptospiraceae bacterium]
MKLIQWSYLCIIQFLGFSIFAQSSVYFCPKTTYYAYCYKGADADECAKSKCQSAGGEDCKPIVSCKNIGHGAIATGHDSEGVSIIGTSCSYDSPEKAKTEAIKQCVKYGGVDCKIIHTWDG